MPEHTPAPTPHRAVYGFAIYLLFSTLFIIYVLWALLPTEKMGLTYLPDKYFALCLPVLVLMGLALFVFFIYPAINASLTPDVDDLATVTDIASVRRICGYGQNEDLNSWEQLKCPKIKCGNLCQETYGKLCSICNVIHCPPEVKPVASLRFLDLEEINDSIFGC